MLTKLIKIKFLLLTGFIFSLPSYALQIKTAIDNEPIKVTISSHELTRISVEGDKILSVAGLTDSYLLQNDEQQGAIFIKPTERTVKQNSFSIFLATQGGHNYILQLTAKKTEAETIILKPKVTKPLITEERLALVPTDQQNITKLLAAMIKREFSKEYVITYFDQRNKQYFKHSNVCLSVVAEYRGKNLLGQIYQIDNKNRKEIVLSEDQFYWKRVKAVALQNRILSARRSCYMYLVTQENKSEV